MGATFRIHSPDTKRKSNFGLPRRLPGKSISTRTRTATGEVDEAAQTGSIHLLSIATILLTQKTSIRILEKSTINSIDLTLYLRHQRLFTACISFSALFQQYFSLQVDILKKASKMKGWPVQLDFCQPFCPIYVDLRVSRTYVNKTMIRGEI